MKKIFTIASFAAAAMMFFSCAKETAAPVEQTTEGYTYTFAISNPGVKSTLNDGATAYKWEDGDSLGVFLTSQDDVQYKGTITVTDEKTYVTVTLDSELEEDDSIYGYYIYSKSNTSAEQVSLSIPTEQDGATIKNAMPMYSDALAVDAGNTELTGTLQMNNLGSVLAFKVFGASHSTETVKSVTFTADGIAGSFDAVDLANSTSVALANGTANSVKSTASVAVASAKADAEPVYMVVAPGTLNGTITVVTDANVYTKTLTTDHEYAANEILTVNVNLDKATAKIVGSGTADDPYTAESALLMAENGLNNASAYVYVSGIISQIDEVSTSYGNATYYISDDGTTTNQFEIFRGYYLGNVKFTAEDQIAKGDKVVVYGKIIYYNSTTAEMTSGNYIYSLNGVKDPALAFSVESAGATMGSDFEEPELTNEFGVTVTYSSSNTDVATVDSSTGEVTLVAVGSTVITATFEGNDDYIASSASYTLNVVAEGEVASVTASIEFSASNTATSGNIDNVISYSGATGGYAQLRIYKNSTFTVSCTTGYTIESIDFTCSATTGNKYGMYTTYTPTVDNGASATLTAETDSKDSNVTVTGNTTSVAITASENQIRITKMSVTYRATN